MDHLNQTNEEAIQGLIEVQTSLAHLEKLVEDLNQVVMEQGKRIKTLEITQRRLVSTIEEIRGREIRQTDSKPPHYLA